MQCTKHPRYKGLTKLGKRNADCPTCNQIHKVIQEEKKEKQKQKYIYNSLTTPGRKSDLAHILAETMTIMKHGLQAENFWQESSTTPQEVKSFFYNCLKLAHIWIGNKVWAANALKGLLYITIVANDLKEEVKDLKIKHEVEEVKSEPENRDLSKSILADCKPKKNIFNMFGDNNE